MPTIHSARERIAGWRPVDQLLRRRASAVMAKTGIGRYLTGSQTILDLGSGTGHIAAALMRASAHSRLILVDPIWRPTKRVIQRLDATERSEWTYLRAQAQDLPIGSNSIDLVLAAFVLHHVAWPDQVHILAEVRRILKPGGRLVLIEDTPRTDAEECRTLLADRILNAETTPAVHNYRTAAEWMLRLSEAEFGLESKTQFTGIPPRVVYMPVPHCCFVSKKFHAR